MPPDDLRVVSEIVANESVEERISRLEKGAYSSASRMPEEMRKEIAAEMRSFALANVSQGPLKRTEVYQIAMWDTKNLIAFKE